MVGRKRKAVPRGGRGRHSSSVQARDSIYREMLVEAGVSRASGSTDSPERPPKRRRPGVHNRPQRNVTHSTSHNPDKQSGSEDEDEDEDENENEDENEDEGIVFEDVKLPEPTVQTLELDSNDEDDEDAVEFEDVKFGQLDMSPAVETPKDLELNLTAQKAASTPPKKSANRRKPTFLLDRNRRADVHKIHLLCLLTHVALRNRWCNDEHVQNSLQPLLSKQMRENLHPATKLPQSRQKDILRKGLELTGNAFKVKFQVTERGIRKALWAEHEEHLQAYQVPDDVDSCLERAHFREAAKTLKGSRDVGAQLYCALLRRAGLDARLVCSLQPLSYTIGGPAMPDPLTPRKPTKEGRLRSRLPNYDALVDERSASSSTSDAVSTPRSRRNVSPRSRQPRSLPSRLGNPLAASYNFEPDIQPEVTASAPKPKRIVESKFPVYWVEVLDVAHQKWLPVDPIVTDSMFNARKFEPPIGDHRNDMTYVVAFEEDGTARDVTRRYVKAYNAKTRRMRIDNGLMAPVPDTKQLSGEKWWQKALKVYKRSWPSDLDQIEINELAAAETQEPMPRNLVDFKDHPLYALERHLRRHEVLIPGARVVGTVGAGSTGPLERIYRRSDVRVARSIEWWYRVGRVVKVGEEPVKFLPKIARKRAIGDDATGVDIDGEEVGKAVFTSDQVELYKPPPIVNGNVPKNKFRNIDIYVPSMVPEGGVHIADETASRAAYVLGVDYAPALTGFSFKGRHGTAVLNGVVVAQEYEEAIRAVITGFADLEAEMEEQQRTSRTLKMWVKFLKVLRIRQRIWANVDPEEEGSRSMAGDERNTVTNKVAEGLGNESDGYGGGGFMEDDDDDDDGGGGGGFLPE